MLLSNLTVRLGFALSRCGPGLGSPLPVGQIPAKFPESSLQKPWGVSLSVMQRLFYSSKMCCKPQKNPQIVVKLYHNVWLDILLYFSFALDCPSVNESQIRTANLGPGWMAEPQRRGEGGEGTFSHRGKYTRFDKVWDTHIPLYTFHLTKWNGSPWR